MEYDKYAQLLTKELKFNAGIALVILVVTVILVVASIKFFKKKFLPIVAGLGGAVIIAMVYFTSVKPYRLDLENQAYDTYEGEFYIQEYSVGNRRSEYVYIKTAGDASLRRYKVLCSMDEIKNDTAYSGYFVVAENSKCLVDIKTNK